MLERGGYFVPALDFKGKSIVYSHHYTVPFCELKLNKANSCASSARSDRGCTKTAKTQKPNLNDNLIIQGDNLLALKALMPRYAGKIKCIYIDPPYNTGNEGWVYNDNVKNPVLRKWLNKEVGIEDLERHDKWLCMMWPRLQMLRELLSDDGVICISIDDTELAHLIAMMNEIFGPENKEEIICWRRRHNQPNDKSKAIAKVAEFIVIWAKNIEHLKQTKSFHGLPLTAQGFSNPDKDPRGPWASTPWKASKSQSGSKYKLKSPTGVEYEEEWLGTQKTFEHLLKQGRIIFSKNGDGLPRKKYYQTDREAEGQVAHNFWGHKDFGSNQDASRELEELGLHFDHPKPVKLVQSIVNIFSDKDSIILDSFAGSGSTGHAVLALNKQDGGHRKFILVQCDEYDKKTQKNINIAHRVTAERVRRVIKGVARAKKILH